MKAQLIQMEFSDKKIVQALIPVTWESEEETKDVLLVGFKILEPIELPDDYVLEETMNIIKGDK